MTTMKRKSSTSSSVLLPCHVMLAMLGSLSTCPLVAQPLPPDSTKAAATPAGTMQTMTEVVVTGTPLATDIAHITPTVTTISRQQLTQYELPNMLSTVADYVPGLFITQRGVMGYGVSTGAAGGMSVRGMQSGAGQVMVLVDGHPQYQGIYGHSIPDALQTINAERVEVVRGPSSLFYGSNAMGGVVNIITRAPQTDGRHTTFNMGWGSYNSIQAEAANTYRKGRFSSDIAANYQGSDNHRDDMQFYQYGGRLRLGYDISRAWRIWGEAQMTHFAASTPGPETAPLLDARQWVNRGVAEFVAENDYGITAGGITVYHNFGRHKINDGHTADAAPRDYLFRSNDALTGVNIHQGVRPWKGGWLTLGFDYQRIHGECWNRAIDSDQHLNRMMEQNMHYPLDTTHHELAAYIDLRQNITPWWTVEAGVRYDHHSAAGGEWVPQGGFVFQPVRDAELKLTAGKGFRVPNLREMYLYAVANPDLKAERLWNYELAWRHRVLSGHLTYGVNLFYLQASNLIATKMIPELGRAQNYNTGKTDHFGGEIEATYNVNKVWSLTTNHSYLHTDRPILAAPTYKGYLGATMRLCCVEVAAGVQQLCGITTQLPAEATATTAAIQQTKEHATLLSAFVAYRPVPAVKLWLRGENLLAQRYELYKGYAMPRATVMAGIRCDL